MTNMKYAETPEEVMSEILDSGIIGIADKSIIKFVNQNVNKKQMRQTIADSEHGVRDGADIAANYWYDYIRELPGYDDALLDPLQHAGDSFTKPELKHAFDILDLPYASDYTIADLRSVIGDHIRHNYSDYDDFYENYLDWVENTAIARIEELMNKYNLMPEKYARN